MWAPPGEGGVGWLRGQQRLLDLNQDRLCRLQEQIKLRNLEHPEDPVQSLLLDLDFRWVGVRRWIQGGSVMWYPLSDSRGRHWRAGFCSHFCGLKCPRTRRRGSLLVQLRSRSSPALVQY